MSRKIEIIQNNFPQSASETINCTTINNIAKDQLTYNEFFWTYMKRNQAVIINSISNEWECSRNWTLDGHVNFQYLRATIPDCKVPVSDCAIEYYNSHVKSEIGFYEFLDYWKHKPPFVEQDDYNSDEENSDDEPLKQLYLKDWHLKKDLPDYDFYTVPDYFVSDWLNEYLIDKKDDDYMFVYMGPKGTWTPFHADVFSSYSWSTNILGRKKWLLLPAGQENKLKDQHDKFPFSINEELLNSKNVQYFTIIQNANEALFVPSGWYHQVWNLDDTISVNHNWFNSCNIGTIWSTLESNLVSVQMEIDNCREMENFDQHCQIILKSCFGINYRDLYLLVKFILDKRLNAVKNSLNTILFGEFALGLNHLFYDIKILQEIVKSIFDNCDMRLLLKYNGNYLNETDDGKMLDK